MSSFYCSLVVKMLMVIFLAFIMSCHASPKDDILRKGRIETCVAEIKSVFKVENVEKEVVLSKFCVDYALAALYPEDNYLLRKKYAKNYHEALKPFILQTGANIDSTEVYCFQYWKNVPSTSVSNKVSPAECQNVLDKFFEDKPDVVAYMYNNDMITSRPEIVRCYTRHISKQCGLKSNAISPKDFCSEFVDQEN